MSSRIPPHKQERDNETRAKQSKRAVWGLSMLEMWGGHTESKEKMFQMKRNEKGLMRAWKEGGGAEHCVPGHYSLKLHNLSSLPATIRFKPWIPIRLPLNSLPGTLSLPLSASRRSDDSSAILRVWELLQRASVGGLCARETSPDLSSLQVWRSLPTVTQANPSQRRPVGHCGCGCVCDLWLSLLHPPPISLV